MNYEPSSKMSPLRKSLNKLRRFMRSLEDRLSIVESEMKVWRTKTEAILERLCPIPESDFRNCEEQGVGVQLHYLEQALVERNLTNNQIWKLHAQLQSLFEELKPRMGSLVVGAEVMTFPSLSQQSRDFPSEILPHLAIKRDASPAACLKKRRSNYDVLKASERDFSLLARVSKKIRTTQSYNGRKSCLWSESVTKTVESTQPVLQPEVDCTEFHPRDETQNGSDSTELVSAESESQVTPTKSTSSSRKRKLSKGHAKKAEPPTMASLTAAEEPLESEASICSKDKLIPRDNDKSENSRLNSRSTKKNLEDVSSKAAHSKISKASRQKFGSPNQLRHPKKEESRSRTPNLELHRRRKKVRPQNPPMPSDESRVMPTTCQLCGHQFSQVGTLNSSTEDTYDYYCPNCNAISEVTQAKLQDPHEGPNQNFEASTETYECPICQRLCKNERKLVKHLHSHSKGN